MTVPYSTAYRRRTDSVEKATPAEFKTQLDAFIDTGRKESLRYAIESDPLEAREELDEDGQEIVTDDKLIKNYKYVTSPSEKRVRVKKVITDEKILQWRDQLVGQHEAPKSKGKPSGQVNLIRKAKNIPTAYR